MTAARRLCVCGQPTRTPRHRRCDLHAGTHGRPDAIVDPCARYETDPAAQIIASRGGSTLEVVAEALGVTRERVRQIQAAALRKLVPRLALVGIDRDDIARILAERPGVPYAEAGSSLPADADARERHRAANRAHMARRRAQARAAGEATPGYTPVEPLPEGAWSEHGQRVEAALVAAEAAVERARRASLRGREVAA